MDLSKDNKPYKFNFPSKPGYYENIRNDNIQLTKVLKIIKNNFEKNSVFMYSSDHGISGKWTTSEKSFRVPFVIKWLGLHQTPIIHKGVRTNVTCTFADVLPTILDIIGADIPDYIDGKSFKNVLKYNTSHEIIPNIFPAINYNFEIHKYIYGVANNQNIGGGKGAKVFPSRCITSIPDIISRAINKEPDIEYVSKYNL